MGGYPWDVFFHCGYGKLNTLRERNNTTQRWYKLSFDFSRFSLTFRAEGNSKKFRFWFVFKLASKLTGWEARVGRASELTYQSRRTFGTTRWQRGPWTSSFFTSTERHLRKFVSTSVFLAQAELGELTSGNIWDFPEFRQNPAKNSTKNNRFWWEVSEILQTSGK